MHYCSQFLILLIGAVIFKINTKNLADYPPEIFIILMMPEKAILLVLNKDFKSSIKPSLQNSFIRNNPASEDKLPPAKFIIICLLISSDKVFTIFIHLTNEKQYTVKIQQPYGFQPFLWHCRELSRLNLSNSIGLKLVLAYAFSRQILLPCHSSQTIMYSSSFSSTTSKPTFRYIPTA